MRLGRRTSLGFLALVLVASSCGSDDASEDASSTSPTSDGSGQALDRTSWDLTSLPAGGDAAASPVAGASLTFGAAGTLSGTTGCNSFSGNYRGDGADLTITLGPMTQRACGDVAVQAQEAAITRLLPATSSYSIADGSLTLIDDDGADLLVYAAAPTSLAGTSWSVTGVNNGRGAVATSTLTEALSAEFAEDGAFVAFGGCNQLLGTFTTSGRDGVTIDVPAPTQQTCGEDVDQLEREFVAALGAVATFEIDGQVLTLRDASGATQVTAIRNA